jgi:drug/metabolite transporter (DMT)-like permease
MPLVLLDALPTAVHTVSLTPLQALGIPVAIVGCVFLAVGAQYQQRGVAKVSDARLETDSKTLGLRQLLLLARRPSWLIGTGLTVASIIFQLFSLYLAPLTVVQPLGALALVITAVLTARTTHAKLAAGVKRAIALCVGGVALFVTVAALTTNTHPLRSLQLVVVLIILGVVLVGFGTAFLVFRSRLPRIVYVVGAGVLFGFVATLAKVLITRIQTIFVGGFHLEAADWLTIVCLLGLILAGLLGGYFQQTAYSSGSTELVVAGLTVIDPIVGVTIGIAVLGEAASAPFWAAIVFVVAGLIAVAGVVQLSRIGNR